MSHDHDFFGSDLILFYDLGVCWPLVVAKLVTKINLSICVDCRFTTWYPP